MAIGASGNLAQSTAVQNAQGGVLAAIHRAAEKTGVDFNYLLTKAQTESSLNPNAKAATSSATGLYQFTDKTWLQMVRDYGQECGLAQFAGAINGDCRVSDAATRKEILSLRNNPEISAYMAAQFTKSNQEQLEKKTDMSVGKTELYLAHFLGAGGASKFLNAYQANPNAAAANLLPTEANANQSVFYDKSGKALSLRQIYNRFASKFNEASPVVDTAPQLTLPLSPALASNALSQTTQSGTLSKIGNINIQLGDITLRALENPSNTQASLYGATHLPNNMTGLSAAALNGIAHQTDRQTLAYLTQVALESLSQSTPTQVLKREQRG